MDVFFSFALFLDICSLDNNQMTQIVKRHQHRTRRAQKMFTKSSVTTLFLVCLASCLVGLCLATAKSAFTFRFYGGLVGQLVTSSTLGWESYVGDEKQLENAVQGGTYHSADEDSYAIHVCRVPVDGIVTTGYTKQQRQKMVCVVSMSGNVNTHHSFEILMNKGNGGKLTWQPWTKFVGSVPTGAVSASGGHVEEYYVARHREHKEHAEHDRHHHHLQHAQYGADFIIGRFDPKINLGKIVVSAPTMDREVVSSNIFFAERIYSKSCFLVFQEYEEGEILTETEPVRYELRQIKIDKWRRMTNRNLTLLGKYKPE
jgi:Protein of unknown function (DUF3421)